MSQATTAASGDTVIGMLKRHRGLKDHEVYQWMDKVRRLNPHISDLNRLYPQEKVLIPDQLNEMVPDTRIWQNAFERIPPALTHNGHGSHQMYICLMGESIDDVARTMFADTPHFHLPHSTKRAVLIHNNPFLRNYLSTNQIPPRTLLDITPVRFTDADRHFWDSQHPYVATAWDQLHEESQWVVQESGAEESMALAEMVQRLQRMGAGVGMQDTVKYAGYGIGGVSGYAASGELALANTQILARELYAEAVAQLGEKAVSSKTAANLARMQHFLTTHPKYQQLMQALKELPEHLLPQGRRVPNLRSGSVNAAARHFRKSFALPYDKWNSTRYLSTIGRQLNGKVSFFKGLGRHATWYVPAIIGVYNVSQGPAEQQMASLFSEGFGIVGGAIGTWVGAELIGVGIVSALCLGPLGAFVVIFLIGAGLGITFAEGSKWFGGTVYSASEKLGNKIFYSAEDLVGALK